MNRRNSTILVALIFFFNIWFAPLLRGVESTTFLQHNAWAMEDGLPVSSVMRITQTPDGYLWIGTEAGLVRFDGIRFETFNHENTPEISTDIVVSLATGRGGSLWFACRDGGVLRYKNNTFKAYTKADGLLDNDAWFVMVASDESVWIGGKMGLNRLSNGKMTTIDIGADNSPMGVVCLLEDRGGRIWAGSRDKGLAVLEKQGDDYRVQYIDIGPQWITTLYEDRKSTVWAGSHEKGIYRFQDQKYKIYNKTHGLSSNDVRYFFEDRFGNLWVGTDGGGVNLLPAGKDHFEMFPNQDELSGTSINCFFQDREGNLWIGTTGGGLNQLRETRIKTYSVKNGLSYRNIYGVFQDVEGRIWCGTKGYGVNYLEQKRFRAYTMADGLSSDSVVTMAQDPAGGIWLGTLGGGINRLLDQRFTVFSTKDGLRNNSSRSVYVDPDGVVWAGTINGWIHRFENGRFVPVANVKSRVNGLIKDKDGTLWAATFGSGLCKVIGSNVQSYNTSHGLSNNIVSSILIDENGILWAGTVKGLNRFENGKITSYFREDGLPDDVVYCILKDRNRDFWISCNRGIYCLRKNDLESYTAGRKEPLKPILFGKESGMRSVECNGGNQPCGWQAHDGKLWFPTTNGVSVVDPNNLGVNKVPPPLVIEKLRVNRVDIPLPDENGRVTQTGGGDLEIHYTAPSFIVPKKIRFKYRLEPRDKQWLEAGSERVVHLPGLPPGEYRFQLIACNSDGVWNNTGITVTFKFKSRFHQTLIFKACVIILLLTLVILAVVYGKRLLSFLKLKNKYVQHSALAPEEAERLVKKLMYLLDVEEIYKNPDLKINTLSSAMLISPRTLSRLINENLHSNFYELINEYRIKASKRLLTEGDTDKSILDISYEVGFNSKSAFNRAFKNFSGLTPSQYRKKNKNK